MVESGFSIEDWLQSQPKSSLEIQGWRSPHLLPIANRHRPNTVGCRPPPGV
ncbi:MAG: hypothetical protein AAFY26_22745 [Cyanobacteria bacterium J06638_22]